MLDMTQETWEKDHKYKSDCPDDWGHTVYPSEIRDYIAAKLETK